MAQKHLSRFQLLDLRTGRKTDRQKENQTNRKTARQIDRQTDRQTNRKTGRRTETQTDSQTGRHAYGQKTSFYPQFVMLVSLFRPATMP